MKKNKTRKYEIEEVQSIGWQNESHLSLGESLHFCFSSLSCFLFLHLLFVKTKLCPVVTDNDNARN